MILQMLLGVGLFIHINVETLTYNFASLLRHAFLLHNYVQAFINHGTGRPGVIVQELCESRGGRPGLSVLTSLLVSVDVNIY